MIEKKTSPECWTTESESQGENLPKKQKPSTETWEEFTDNTTLHGLQETPFRDSFVLGFAPSRRTHLLRYNSLQDI